MFTQEQLEGVILASANPEIEISKDEASALGYRVRVRILFRSFSLDFLNIIKQNLDEVNITSRIKEKEKSNRPNPILIVSKIEDILEFVKLLPDLPDSSNKFDSFLTILSLISNKHHLTQKGLDKILKIQGLSI